jgi:hypothetical protein
VVDALAKRLPVAPSAQQALTQTEEAADRFLQGRAARVAHDRRLGVDRYSTPELLVLERQLVDGATQRTEQGCAVVRPEVIRQVVDRYATAGEDQAAMVRDLTQGGDGVALVVGRAGSGKTWALGLAKEAFELDGYQVLGTAATGIATVGLADEGLAEARTVDRLLLDLAKGCTELDDRSVLVVDEAAMVATRKLAPSSAMRSRPAPRWCWSATTASSPHPGRRRLPRPASRRLGADRQPPPGGGMGAARHRRHPRRQPGAGDRRLRRARPPCAPRAAPSGGRCWPWTGSRTCRAATCSSPGAPTAPTCT